MIWKACCTRTQLFTTVGSKKVNQHLIFFSNPQWSGWRWSPLKVKHTTGVWTHYTRVLKSSNPTLKVCKNTPYFEKISGEDKMVVSTFMEPLLMFTPKVRGCTAWVKNLNLPRGSTWAFFGGLVIVSVFVPKNTKAMIGNDRQCHAMCIHTYTYIYIYMFDFLYLYM